MTCIVGIAKDGHVYMGADSAGVGGYSLTVRADRKLFQLGPMLIGFTTSFRMGQILRYEDFQVAESADGFDACGSAEDIARGSLYSSPLLGVAERLRLALSAAQHFNAGVREPFYLLDGGVHA